MRRILVIAILCAGAPATAAHAAMGTPTMMSRLDADGDHKLSRSEVKAAAGRRYDLIRSKNGDRVTMLQLGGRLVPADLPAVGGQADTQAPVSKERYLQLVDKFFDDALGRRAAAHHDELVEGDLDTPSGKKLLGLLQ